MKKEYVKCQGLFERDQVAKINSLEFTYGEGFSLSSRTKKSLEDAWLTIFPEDLEDEYILWRNMVEVDGEMVAKYWAISDNHAKTVIYINTLENEERASKELN